MSRLIPVADARARFYRRLAVVLGLGIVGAAILGLAGVQGPGWFTPDGAFFTLAGVVLVTTFVLVVFLLRMVSVFDDLDRIRSQTLEEARQAEDARQKVVRELESLQAAVRADLATAKAEREKQAWRLEDTVRTEVANAQRAFAAELRAGWERDVTRIQAVAERTEKDVDARLTRAEAALHAATQSAEERARLDFAAAQRRDAVVMQKEAEVTNQIKDLQETTAALQKGLKVLDGRVGTAVESMERSEMEVAAQRTKAERELADVRKRAELLIIKNRELEEAVQGTTASSGVIRLAEKDTHHVLAVAGVGARNADLLAQAGVGTVDLLAASDALDLARRVQKVPGGAGITEGTVNRWIQAARAKEFA